MKRDDWLEWRRNGIGASEVAGVLGLSPWQSPWSIWAEKTGLIPGAGVTEAMEFGLMAEVMLKQYFEKRTGLYVAGEQTWCAKPGDEWMRCTVDGFVLDPEVSGRPPDTFDLAASTAVYEAKTTSEPPWDEVPTHYACQAQWQMAVTGMPVCWFGVLHIAFGRPTFRVYEFDLQLGHLPDAEQQLGVGFDLGLVIGLPRIA